MLKSHQLRRVLLISTVLITPLICLQVFPLSFALEERALERLGWPFWFDRQYTIVFPGLPNPIWHSYWFGKNLWAIAGNVAASSLIFVLLVATGYSTNGFRRLRIFDLCLFTTAVALAICFRIEIQLTIQWCEAVLGSKPATPGSTMQSVLTQSYSIAVVVGVMAVIRLCCLRLLRFHQAKNQPSR